MKTKGRNIRRGGKGASACGAVHLTNSARFGIMNESLVDVNIMIRSDWQSGYVIRIEDTLISHSLVLCFLWESTVLPANLMGGLTGAGYVGVAGVGCSVLIGVGRRERKGACCLQCFL